MFAHGTHAVTIAAGQRIVRWHAGWTAGASFIPLPFVDIAGVMAVQVSMVRQLARLHGCTMDGTRPRTLLLSALGGAASPTVTASGIPSMLKLVPGIGTVLAGVAAPCVAVAATVGLGNLFNDCFAKARDPLPAGASQAAQSPAIAALAVLPPLSAEKASSPPGTAETAPSTEAEVLAASAIVPPAHKDEALPLADAYARPVDRRPEPTMEFATPKAEDTVRARRGGQRRSQSRAATVKRPATRKPTGDQPQ